MKIYLAGYAGRKPEQLKQLSDVLEATVVDIRLSPRSRVPYWDSSALKSLLGSNYVWVRELGNVNYKGFGEISILDMTRGVDRVVGIGLLSGKDMILLCACKNGCDCHRTVVGKRFTDLGFEVQEVDWSIIAQPVLF